MTTTEAPSFAGPVDRVHFADEQRRYRRKSWRFTAFAALAVLTTGIPACIVVTPLIYAVVLVGAYIVNVFSPLSPATWASLQRLAEAIPRAVQSIDEGGALRNIPRIAQGVAVLVVPGALS